MLVGNIGKGIISANVTAFYVQEVHRSALRKFGAKGARVNRMNVPKQFGKASWIADELVGIRTLEERLSKKLTAQPAANNRVLLDGIRDLNTRVEKLDRAIDEFSRSRRAA